MQQPGNVLRRAGECFLLDGMEAERYLNKNDNEAASLTRDGAWEATGWVAAALD